MENTTIVAGKSGIIKAEAKLVIKDFVDVMGGFEPGRSIKSDPFMLGDTPLEIEVYPNGYDNDVKGHVSLFLNNNGERDISVKGELATTDSELEAMEFDYTTTVGAGQASGVDKFLTHAKCAAAFKDEDFVVEAKLEIPGEVTKIAGGQSAQAPKKRKLSVLEKVYNKMTRTDFAFVFEGTEVPCHKIVLAAASPALEAMVENKHREAIEGRANMKLSAEVGRAFIQFVYTEQVPEDIMKEHALAFLALGELYDLQELKGKAEAEMLSQLDKENMVEMLSVAEFYRADDIFEAALKMAKVNMAWLRSQVFSIL